MLSKEHEVGYALRRSKIDIIVDILRVANRGSKKTRIMYKCNLSHRQLQAYLKLLLGMEFLVPHSEKDSGNPAFFKTTAKGLEFIDVYHTLKALMG